MLGKTIQKPLKSPENESKSKQYLIIMREDMVKISDIIKHLKDTGSVSTSVNVTGTREPRLSQVALELSTWSR